MRLKSIEIVEDRSCEARCDAGFLVVSRLRLRNESDDDSDAAGPSGLCGRAAAETQEEGGAVVVPELGEAIAACRSGEIPDMKTKLGLLRLADPLGFIPRLDCFEDELPPDLRSRHRRLGVTAVRDR